MSDRDLASRYEHYRALLPRWGQQHLLRFWDSLSDAQRAELLDDLDRIDFKLCASLIEMHVRRRPELPVPQELEPPPMYPARPQDAEQQRLYAEARERGVDAVRSGRVAALLVAGGQGTRLGFEGPKGAFPISPVRNATLFQLFAESLLGVERRWGVRPRWYIMTSPTNDAATRAFFEQQAFFGLDREDVFFFQQRQMPAFLPDGRIAMTARHRIALSPDGHGGTLRALAESGALDDMRACGIETLSYFQVDNPLVHVIDPLFIGLHRTTGSEFSSKAVRKRHDTERVGNFCLADGKLCVIEYSDLPDELARQKNPDGSRRFDAGSIAVHVIERSFVERLTAAGAAETLPWHRALKKMAVIDEAGEPVRPAEPNVIKLERFVFDAIPLARNPLVLETLREEEFSPVKNAEGDDSPATARRDLVRRAARWLESCGVRVPRRADGEPDATIEIVPSFALDAQDLGRRLDRSLRIEPGSRVLIDERSGG